MEKCVISRHLSGRRGSLEQLRASPERGRGEVCKFNSRIPGGVLAPEQSEPGTSSADSPLQPVSAGRFVAEVLPPPASGPCHGARTWHSPPRDQKPPRPPPALRALPCGLNPELRPSVGMGVCCHPGPCPSPVSPADAAGPEHLAKPCSDHGQQAPFLFLAFTDKGGFAAGHRSCRQETPVLPGQGSSGWAPLPASSPGNEGFP